MLSYSVNMDVFLKEFITMVKSVIVKQDVKAAQYETADTKRDSDRYVAMKEGLVSWSSIVRFDREVLLAAGISESIVDELYNNKDLIPVNLRELCVNLQIQKSIAEYVERNNYYRMLNGEPDIEDEENKNYIYMFENDKGIDTTTPIHLLPLSELTYINNSDLLDKLIELHPNAEYLKHLGNKAVPYNTARMALNYSILYIEKSNIDSLNVNFGKYYAAARTYVMKGLYHNEDKAMFPSYDGFMGFNIMAMAINRVIASTFTQGITREFYDDDLIKTLYECYNIQYEESIAVKHHREIAKRLNTLLRVKSSKKVIYDIISLFNYRSVHVYEYYLVKDVKKDENGDPVFIYKDVVDEEGNVQRVIDPEKTYDIYFQKVDVNSEDPTIELANDTNKIPYETLTYEDPYWIDDSDLLNKIYFTNFNSISTKYMSLDVAFDLAKIMYETSHAFRMILEKHPETKGITIKTPYSSDPMSIFDAVIFICALVAKKFGLTGEIPLKPWNIAHVYGFNFKTDLDELREDIVDQIEANHGVFSEVDPKVLSFIKSRTIRTIEDVIEMFDNIEALRVFIDTAMRKTTSLDAYRGYERLYKALLVTTDYADIYTKLDGTLASTYLELLESRRPDLVKYVNGDADMTIISTGYNSGSDENDVNTKINRMFDSIAKISESLNDIQYANAKDEIVNNLEKVINQFKSYTVDMQDSGILYVINDPHMCMLKILDWIKHYVNMDINVDTLIEDVLIEMTNIRHDDHIKTDEQRYMSKMLMLSHCLKIWDKLSMLVSETVKDKTDILDTITNMFNKMVLPKIVMKVDSQLAYIDGKMSVDDILNLSDDIWRVFAESCFKDKTFMVDSLKQQSILAYLMFLKVKDMVFYDVKMCFNQPIELIEKIAMEKDIAFSFDTSIIDALSEEVSLKLTPHHVNLSDWLDIKRFLHPNDLLVIRHELTMNKEVSFDNVAAVDIIDALILSIGEATVRHGITLPDKVKSTATMVLGSNRAYPKGFTNVIRTNYLGESKSDGISSGAVVYTLNSPAIFIAGNNTVEDNCRPGDHISLRDTLKIIYE